MGFWDFLFKKKEDKKEEIEEDFKFEPLEAIPVNIPTDENIVETTSFSKTRKEKDGMVEYIYFYVAGVAHYQESIKTALKETLTDYNFSLEKYDGMSNKEIQDETFDDKVYEYSDILILEAYLQVEPDNEYDSKAIAVMYKDSVLGYVPKKNYTKAKNYIYKLLDGGLKENQRLNFTAILHGGKYKINYDEGSLETGQDNLKVEGEITIKTKEV